MIMKPKSSQVKSL